MNKFQPDYMVPPGETIRKLAGNIGLNSLELQERLKLTGSEINSLALGSKPITQTIALRLSKCLGGSPDFWTRREYAYRSYLQKAERLREDEKNWLGQLPVKEIFQMLGKAYANRHEVKLSTCLEFFGVSTIDDWYSNYSTALHQTAFRTSSSFSSSDVSVIYWLKKSQDIAELGASEMPKYDEAQLRNELSAIRSLILLKDVTILFPKLVRILRRCGVALVYSPSPKGCRASGATFFVEGMPVVVLSGRHKTEDHFWFTLFHELGHVLLHSGGVHIDIDLSSQGTLDQEEQEANDFAMEIIIPSADRHLLEKLSIRNWRQIPRVARDLGLSTGVLIGQLQHLGSIHYSQLNKFKVKYDYEAIALNIKG
jgi:plasmid maintenance system antidote protein VapI